MWLKNSNAGGAELGQLLMQGLALPVGGDLDHVTGLAVAAAEARGLFAHLIGVVPVDAAEAHAFGQIGDDSPVRLGIAAGIVELLIQADAPLAVGPHETLLARGGRREHHVGIAEADGVAQVDVLVDHHPAPGVRARLQGVDDLLFVPTAHLVGIVGDQFLELGIQALGTAPRRIQISMIRICHRALSTLLEDPFLDHPAAAADRMPPMSTAVGRLSTAFAAATLMPVIVIMGRVVMIVAAVGV